MDDFGNELHWTTQVHGAHSLALYGYSDDYGIGVLHDGVDYYEVRS